MTNAHDDLLSGRSFKDVLGAFITLYGIASLGGLLNSTWLVACVLWCGPLRSTGCGGSPRLVHVVGMQSRRLAAADFIHIIKGVVVVVTAAVRVESFLTRVILGFIALVAMSFIADACCSWKVFNAS